MFTSSARGKRRSDGLSTTVITAAALQVVLFAWYLKANLILQPYWDMYAHVTRYLQYQDDGRWWAFLWAPHVQHRNVWIHLLTAIDAGLFNGVGYPFVVFATLCMAVATALIWREFHRGVRSELRVPLGCLAIMLMLTSVAAVDCAIPMNGIYPQALMFAVLAFVLFNGAADFGHHPDPTIHWRRAAALLAAMAAAMGNAGALVVWPILVWMAWRGGAGRTWTVLAAATGAAFIWIYVDGLPIAAEGELESGGLDRLVKMAIYLVTYLGLPLSRSAALLPAAQIAGAVLLVSSLAAILAFGFIRKDTGRLERLAVALIAFTIGTAVLAAIGRVDVEGAVLVPVRYSVFVAPLHVGLLMIAAHYFSRHWQTTRRRAAIKAIVASAASALLVQQIAAGQTAAATTRSMKDALQRFVAGETTPEMKQIVFDDLNQARRDLDRIRQAGLYLNAR